MRLRPRNKQLCTCAVFFSLSIFLRMCFSFSLFFFLSTCWLALLPLLLLPPSRTRRRGRTRRIARPIYGVKEDYHLGRRLAPDRFTALQENGNFVPFGRNATTIVARREGGSPHYPPPRPTPSRHNDESLLFFFSFTYLISICIHAIILYLSVLSPREWSKRHRGDSTVDRRFYLRERARASSLSGSGYNFSNFSSLSFLSVLFIFFFATIVDELDGSCKLISMIIHADFKTRTLTQNWRILCRFGEIEIRRGRIRSLSIKAISRLDTYNSSEKSGSNQKLNFHSSNVIYALQEFVGKSA